MEQSNLPKPKTDNGQKIIIAIGAVLLILGILRFGMAIGERRAVFSGHFGDNFERNFIGPRSGFGMGMMGGPFPHEEMLPGGHGAVGEIVSLNLPEFVVSGPDNLEKTIIVNASTTLRQFRENITADKLQVGNFVVVLGSPNESGQIEAKLIRIMP